MKEKKSKRVKRKRFSFGFHIFAEKASELVGHAWTFSAALGLVLIWLITGPIFKFSPNWQLVMNTICSVITFLMVFVIQSGQKRSSLATQLKLNELIRSHPPARNSLIDLVKLSDKQLKALEKSYLEISREDNDAN